MFLLRTTASSWKGLGDIVIDWVKHNNLIGKNQAGKTAVLESIIDTFDKIDVRQLPEPINNKDGATTCEYEHEFTMDGKTSCLKISRMYRKAGNKNVLKIEPDPPEGFTLVSLLKILWPNASKMDVAELKRRTINEWLEDILDMMGIKSQLSELEREDKQLRNDRLIAGRDKTTSAAAVPKQRPEKVEPVDVGEIKSKLNTARQSKQKYDHEYSQWDHCQNQISLKETAIEQLKREIEKLERAATTHYDAYTELDNSPELVETLETELTESNEINRQADDYALYDDLVADAKTQLQHYDDLNAKVRAIPRRKGMLFTDNDCPVDGIEYTIDETDDDDKGQLVYDGVPLQQINEGSRMLLGAQIMLNKLSSQTITMDDGTEIDSLQLLMIENGSQADTETRRKIRELCDNHKPKVQTIFELVINEKWNPELECLVPDYDTALHSGVVIEEGEVYHGKD